MIIERPIYFYNVCDIVLCVSLRDGFNLGPTPKAYENIHVMDGKGLLGKGGAGGRGGGGGSYRLEGLIEGR